MTLRFAIELINAFMKEELQNAREDYTLSTLERDRLKDNPMAQFEQWYKDYQALDTKDANAMTLSTVNSKGEVSARVVLLKGTDEEGFVFYTNYTSRKAMDMERQSRVALSFFWPALERQVRVEGTAEKVSSEISDEYFASRPRGSQIGAWASPQSEVIESRQSLEERTRFFGQKFKDQDIPRPDFWGGYRVRPERVEFWQGRSSRLHDRLVYILTSKRWTIDRLAP